MKTFSDTSAATALMKIGSVVVIGNFDGVHFGHQQILKAAKAFAAKHKLKLCVLSFEPHPVKILAPQIAPVSLQTPKQKLECLKDCDVDIVVLQKFDMPFSQISPVVFFNNHLLKNLNAKAIFVGYDFTFGKKRSGTTETLEQLAKEHHVTVHVTSAQMQGNVLVSSTLIRKLLVSGDLKDATRYLTRPYCIDGSVAHGFKRGTALGIHTANLNSENELALSDGVYATRVEFKNKNYNSVTNIGLNPTFENTTRSIETHIFDFDQEIYDQKLRLHFVQKLREEIKFANVQALLKQIEKDIVQAKKILGAVKT